ncbi:MAG: S1 family peptidase [Anaerolineae bacterium]|nr:S1 family peptidase [Anaerolineae bacterium]
MSAQDVFQAQAQAESELLNRSNVVGVAVGYKDDKTAQDGELSVVVLVERKLPLSALSATDVIPKQIDGVRTDVFEVGYLRAYDTPRDRFRPTIPSGVSIGHYKITAGTLGTIVTDRRTGEKLILSNNHVLANSNDALVGDPILQPGPADGGQNPGDMVARLERFVKLRYVGDPEGPLPPTPDPGNDTPGCDILTILVNILNVLAGALGSGSRLATVPQGSMAAKTVSTVIPTTQATDNLADCAVAKPVNPAAFTGEIRGIGQVSGTKAASLGMRVRKSGRTTDYTEGVITLLNATVNVAYGAKTARFTGQVITEAMSQGGDSGSLIVDTSENKAVGLLFAGSNVATIFNPINAVLDALQVNL